MTFQLSSRVLAGGCFIGALVLLQGCGGGTTTTPTPTTTPPKTKPETARWMTHTFTWGVLSTNSTRSHGATLGDAFGNPYSFADVKGVPYFFASDLDASMIDLFSTKQTKRASFTLSEAQLTGTSRAVPSCELGAGFGDPENPPCARLILTGNMVKLAANKSETKTALAALIARHPSFANYTGLGFYVVKMEVDEIFFIGAYGGPDFMKPSDYFSAKSALHASYKRKTLPTGPPGPPNSTDQIGTARWMARTFIYGTLSTTSTRPMGSTVGDPFGNPYSFADNNTGVPYFFASDLDASMIDLFVGDNAKPRASFTLSEAQLEGDRTIKRCKIGAGFDDPENPPCARLILSGKMVKLAANTTEAKGAFGSLITRHPSFANYTGLGFYVVKMVVDEIFFIGAYGGPNFMKPTDYFAGKSVVRPLLV